MAEKRQIQFERYTNLPLGGNWAGEWPAYVLVHHEGAVDDVRYVPERTCEMLPLAMAAVECSACGHVMGKHDVERFCPGCGCKVVEGGKRWTTG